LFGFKKDSVTLGSKRVAIPKLTRSKLKLLTDHIGTIGEFLVKLFLTPPENRAAFIVAGADITIDEIYELTSILSGLPIDYLDKEVGLAECSEFLKLTWERNDMNAALGNLQSLLHPMALQFVQGVAQRMEKAKPLQ